jgi:RimJ/RimL family protein N-acetyltransferase
MKEKGQGDVKMNDKLLSLKTERLVLHSFSDSDIDYALSIFYNDEIKKTYMLPDFPSRENAVALFERLERLSMNPARFVYGIYLDEPLIGFINDVEIADQTIEVGYVIHPNYQNHGYMTEALIACIEELFRIGYTTVKAGYFEENPASGRVMEKSGMHKVAYTDTIEYRDKTHTCIYYEATN